MDMSDMDRLCERKSRLICYACDHEDELSVHEMGCIVDMIKDISEVERNSKMLAGAHEAMDAIRNEWERSDMEARKRMKADMVKLTQEMSV